MPHIHGGYPSPSATLAASMHLFYEGGAVLLSHTGTDSPRWPMSSLTIVATFLRDTNSALRGTTSFLPDFVHVCVCEGHLARCYWLRGGVRAGAAGAGVQLDAASGCSRGCDSRRSHRDL